MNQHPSARTVSSFSLAVFAVMPWAALSAAEHRRPPLAFVENQGQWPESIAFGVRAGGVTAGLERGAIHLRLRDRDGYAAVLAATVHLRFEGALETVEIEGEEKQRGVYNFFRGQDCARWRSGVPAYASVLYRGLYDGVDLRVREGWGRLEYDVIFGPGAELERVVVRCEGIHGLAIDGAGGLVLETAFGPLRQSPPRTWQELPGGERRPIDCRYRLLDRERYGFEAPEADPRWRLVIDPVLEWSVELGGSGGVFDGGGGEHAWGIALDPGGDPVVAGVTPAFDFPVGGEDRVFSEELGGPADSFLTRLEKTTGEIVYATFFGGTGHEAANALAISPQGEVSFAGFTTSDDLPVTNDSTFRGVPLVLSTMDAFVARLSQRGDELLYSTYLGGAGEDGAHSLSLRDDGSLVVSGWTSSRDFPTTEGALQRVYGGGDWDAFVALVRPGPGEDPEEQLIYSTYFGGSGAESRSHNLDVENHRSERVASGSHALDSAGHVVLVGTSNSANLRVTATAYQANLRGGWDGFVARIALDPALGEGQLLYATRLGGSQNEAVSAVAVDPGGGVWLSGYTWSPDFPTTGNALDRLHGGQNDAFITRLDPSRPPPEQLVYSTLLGGAGTENAAALGLHPDGSVVVAGTTSSTEFPTTAGALQESYQGGLEDGFLCVLEADPAQPPAEHLRYSTFLSSTLQIEELGNLAVRPQGRVVVTGVALTDDFSQIDALVISLDLRLPRASFTVAELGKNRFELDPSGSTTPEGTVITRHDWDFGDGETLRDRETPAAFSHEYRTAGRHVAALTVTNDLGLQSTTHRLVTAGCPAGDVSPWMALDIGEPAFPGAARWADAEPADEAEPSAGLALCAGGELLAGTSDRFLFVHQEAEGDAVLSARIDEATGTASSWQLGVMLRESLAPAARHATMLVQRSGLGSPRFRSVRRLVENTQSTQGATVELPRAYVRIERQGDEFIASASADGSEESFSEVSRVTIEGFPHRYLAGLIAIGHDANPTAAFTPLAAVVSDLGLVERPRGLGPFLRGDCNGDGQVAGQVTDAVFLLNHNFSGGPAPPCLAACDANGDGQVLGQVTDAVYLLQFNFLGGRAPPAPYPECGRSELDSDAMLGCAAHLESCP